MTRVLYFSAAGHSRAVAEYVASLLGTKAGDIQYSSAEESIEADTAVLVFPVYCQTLPPPVRAVIDRIKARDFVLIATYGCMNRGNALYEAAVLCKGDVIGAAYIPTGHSYLHEDADFDRSALTPLVQRIARPKKIKLPQERAQSWAAIFPALRSRLGLRIKRGSGCTKCGLCTSECPMGAMDCGKTGRGCIRCLRCVYHCPERALDFRLSLPMRLYLQKRKSEDTIIYL